MPNIALAHDGLIRYWWTPVSQALTRPDTAAVANLSASLVREDKVYSSPASLSFPILDQYRQGGLPSHTYTYTLGTAYKPHIHDVAGTPTPDPDTVGYYNGPYTMVADYPVATPQSEQGTFTSIPVTAGAFYFPTLNYQIEGYRPSVEDPEVLPTDPVIKVGVFWVSMTVELSERRDPTSLSPTAVDGADAAPSSSLIAEPAAEPASAPEGFEVVPCVSSPGPAPLGPAASANTYEVSAGSSRAEPI